MTLTYPKNGETLVLNSEACVGCGACVDVCPHAVFRIEAGKAEIVRRATCMECGACARNCPAGALSVQAGVGCAAALTQAALRGGGSAPSCGCDDGGGCCG